MKILVIGAGWYGCHLAHVLQKDGHEITIVDKANDFFTGSSSKNQNRLHLGFHYPRSTKTMSECIKGYSLFIDNYHDLIEDLSNNVYFISNNDSLLNFNEYVHTLNNKNYIYELIDSDSLNIKIQNVHSTALRVNEKYINPIKSRDFFKERLTLTTLYDVSLFNSINTILSHVGRDYDLILNCTYNQLEPIEYEDYEIFLTLLYHIEAPTFAYTIMDGMFFSIYPYDIEKHIYTVTHVNHCVIYKGKILPESMHICPDDINKIKDKIDIEIEKYIPSWTSISKYIGYYTSCKTKHDNITDDRSVKYKCIDNILHIYGGKITGIFEAETIVRSIICEKT
jgi:hypothetical protein